MNKEYLGDGAYVSFDGYSLIVTAEDGIRATNTIVLEPEVFVMLLRYAQRAYPEIRAIQTEKANA